MRSRGRSTVAPKRAAPRRPRHDRMADQATFVRYVREAFARLDDRPYLQAHPLASLLAGAGQPPSAEVLRRSLLAAIEELRPPSGTPAGSPTWRRWRWLALRYVEG